MKTIELLKETETHITAILHNKLTYNLDTWHKDVQYYQYAPCEWWHLVNSANLASNVNLAKTVATVSLSTNLNPNPNPKP